MSLEARAEGCLAQISVINNKNTVLKIISGISDFSILLPLAILIARGVRYPHHINQFVALFVALTFIRNAITFIMATQYGSYNIYIYNWHCIISFLVVVVLYHQLLKKRYAWVIMWIAFVLSFVSVSLDYTSFFNTQTTNFSRLAYNVAGSITVILILSYFYELIQNLQVANLTKFPLFWFSAGALFYYSGTIFTYIFVETTFNNISNRNNYWMIDAILFIVFSISMAISVWYMKPQR